MNAHSWAESILFGEHIDDKIFCPNKIIFEKPTTELSLPKNPARDQNINISTKKIKFPKSSSFHELEKKKIALHAFANHELMAIEIFAAFFLLFPVHEEHFKPFQSQLVQTLKEEQKHFLLYKHRLEELGSHFGDFPRNDFFWRLVLNIKTPREFFSVVSLSLEAANLDFAKYYASVFRDVEDDKSAAIMDVIYNDEIKHVALGRHYLEKQINDDVHLWDFYCAELPDSFSPARAKGIVFDRDGRLKAGLDDKFISASEHYRDKFSVVNRKQWK